MSGPKMNIKNRLNAEPSIQTGKLLSYKLSETYTIEQINLILADPVSRKILSESGCNALPAKNAVAVYRVIYNTPDNRGFIVKASGILCVPGPKSGQYPFLSFQHGTILSKHETPFYANKCSDAKALINVFAGQGYVVAMPDYIGQGKSNTYHPYLNASTEASASLDMIKAAQSLCKKLGVKLNAKLFITGYSQGGHVTAALGRLMKKKRTPITASALLAGVYDLNKFWKILENYPMGALSNVLMARMVIAYNKIYGLYGSYTEIFNPPYAKKVPPLFNELHSEFEIAKLLPPKSRDLFRKDFLEKTDKRKNRFANELKKNSVNNWKPESPTRLYNSKGDTLVVYEIMKSTYKNMKALGGNVKMSEIPGNLEHVDAFTPAIFEAKKWFDSF